ncbi:hypothetical protein [Nannocystis pusilla]|uniref:hypothetical protein n=1 Tax=Nannocystis pusilla TaxID=889268 RepID=UPI003B7D0823
MDLDHREGRRQERPEPGPWESHVVNYDVTVGATAKDSYWAVSGTITIHNPAYVAATITSVTDVISPGIVADVDCGVAFPYMLEPGQDLLCTYTADLPDGADRTNTATVTTYGPVGGGVGTAPVTFYGPTAEKDECVEVVDDQFGVLGTVCAADAPKTFEYSLKVGPYYVCGPHEFTNTACFETNDTGTTGCDSHVVYIDFPCDAGCTLTQGYWKTHSHHGPAPEDATWFDLGDVDGDGVSEGPTRTSSTAARPGTRSCGRRLQATRSTSSPISTSPRSSTSRAAPARRARSTRRSNRPRTTSTGSP